MGVNNFFRFNSQAMLKGWLNQIKSINQTRLTLLAVVFVFAVTVFVLLPTSPKYVIIPDRDSGVFLYMGDQLLKGKDIYVDLWDHKPPMVIWINALGLILSPGSWLGVWALQFIFLAATIWFGWKSMVIVGINPWIGLVVMLVTILNVVNALGLGNFTEQYALLFQAVALFIFFAGEQKKARGGSYLLLGMTSACAFLLKPNLIGVWIAIFGYWLIAWLFKKDFSQIRKFGFTALGSVILLVIVALYFLLIKGSFYPFWDAVFSYNYIYSEAGLNDRLITILSHIQWLLQSSIFYALVLAAWLGGVIVGLLQFSFIRKLLGNRWIGSTLILCGMGIFFFLSARWTLQGVNWLTLNQTRIVILATASLTALVGGLVRIGWTKRTLFPFLTHWGKQFLTAENLLLYRFGLIFFAIDLLMVAVSPRNFAHYLIPLILSSAIWVGLLFNLILFLFPTAPRIRYSTMGALTLILCVLPVSYNLGKMQLRQNPTRQSAIELIEKLTVREDTVLLWGSEAGIHFITGRASPTRFFYQYPLYKSGYTTPILWEEMIRAISEQTPKLIIDTRNANTPLFAPPLGNPGSEKFNPNPTGLDLMKAFMDTHYELIDDSLGMDRWQVYQYRDSLLTR